MQSLNSADAAGMLPIACLAALFCWLSCASGAAAVVQGTGTWMFSTADQCRESWLLAGCGCAITPATRQIYWISNSKHQSITFSGQTSPTSHYTLCVLISPTDLPLAFCNIRIRLGDVMSSDEPLMGSSESKLSRRRAAGEVKLFRVLWNNSIASKHGGLAARRITETEIWCRARVNQCDVELGLPTCLALWP